MYKIRQKITSAIAAFSLVLNSFIPLLTSPVYAQEAVELAQTESKLTPSPEPSSSPELFPSPSSEPTPQPTPSPSPTLIPLIENPESTSSASVEPSPNSESSTPDSPSPPLWVENNGVYTIQSLRLFTTYHFPPNERVALTFTKLPDTSGRVIVKEHEVPEGVENAGSKDYEITSNMPNGSFSFDLTLPTTDPSKKVLTSDDGQNYEEISNESVVSTDVISIKGITHLTHFIVADETADFNHPVINEFFPDGSNEWVEIYNPTSQEQNITGWSIEDNDPETGSPFSFPENSTIPTKGFLAVDITVLLNDPGDTINFIAGDGTLLDSRTYTSDPGSSSIGRIVDGGPDWKTFPTSTQGVSNDTNLNALYVDRNWSSPSNDGDHTWGFDAFATIADAINFAPVGSTINVSAGTYEERITIAKSLTLSGAGTGTTSIDGCEDVITITASNVSVKGFTLTDSNCRGGSIVYIGSSIQSINIEGNIIQDGKNGIYNNGSTNTTIKNNEIRNNTYGVYMTGDISGSEIKNNNIHDNGQGISATGVSFSELSISLNQITNSNDGYGVYFNAISGSVLTISQNQITGSNSTGIYLSGGGAQISDSTVTISQNTVSSNGSNGIYADVILNSTFNVSNNTISSNTDRGIYLINFDSTSTVSANQNNILGHNVGVQNDDAQDFFDATLNFWGDASGPLDANLNPNGLGNRVTGRVLFSPFYTDSARSTITEIEFNASNINLANFDDLGIFDLSEDGEDLVRYVDVLQQLELEAIENGGENDIVLPEGVRIKRRDDLEFDWDSLSLQDVAESLMSGFDSTTSIVDAIQWGIPGVELEFSTPITVRIFVGTALNGQTLNVVRSTSGSGGWTSTGIVTPATCTVTEGTCTFQATLASYFAATSTTPTPAPTASQALSQAGGSVAAPTCDDQKPGSAPTLLNAAAGIRSVTLNWSKAKNPVTYYLLNYSTIPGEFQFGNPNVGGVDTTSYQVSGLSGATTYYFRVRAGNGCAPGDYSNELAVAPRGSFISGPAAGFAPGILGAKKPIGEEKVTATPILQPPTPQVSEDNLFSRILDFVSNFFKRLFGK